MNNVLSKLSRYLILFAFLCFSNVNFGQVKEGDRAPEIFYNTSFPKDYMLPIKKAMLLDFWATWCGPCIEGIKESNEWVPQYFNQIEFVCITNHTSKNVGQFIQKGNFNHVFLIDSTNQTFNRFGVGSLPTVFLIDTNGVIVWRGHSKDVTKSFLDEFLRTGKVPKQEQTKTVSMNLVLENNFKKTAEDQIKGPSFSMMGSKGDSIKYLIKNKSLEQIIELLYNKPKQVIFNHNRFTTHYDLQVARKNVDIKTINLEILDEISKHIPFSYKIEYRDTSITELVVMNEDLLYSNRTQYDSILGANDDHSIDYEYTSEKVQVLSANNISPEELAFELAGIFDMPVITNTSIQDRFNFDQIPIADYNLFCEILLNKYGLALKFNKLKIPFLIIN